MAQGIQALPSSLPGRRPGGGQVHGVYGFCPATTSQKKVFMFFPMGKPKKRLSRVVQVLRAIGQNEEVACRTFETVPSLSCPREMVHRREELQE